MVTGTPGSSQRSKSSVDPWRLPLGACVLQLEEERAEGNLTNELVKENPGQDKEPEGNPDR